MMNIVWGFMIIVGLIMGMINGMGGALLDAMVMGAGEAVVLCIEIGGAYMLWLGIMEVAKDMGLIERLAKLVRPLLCKLFPNAKEAIAPITLNLAANFFGLGSAATPFGLESMRELQRYNKAPNIATNDMCMFIALNASALELLPTTILAMRSASGSTNSYVIVLPTFVASVVSFLIAIALCKLLEKFSENSNNTHCISRHR